MNQALPLASLYHAPFACSMACRIAAAYWSVPIDLKVVNLFIDNDPVRSELAEVNPANKVPTLVTAEGLLTENSAVLLWLGQQVGATSFQGDAWGFLQTIRWLSFCATELHKQVVRPRLAAKFMGQDIDTMGDSAPEPTFKVLNEHLKGKTWLVSDSFGPADAYLIWALVIARSADIILDDYPVLLDYRGRALSTPSIAEVVDNDNQLQASLQPSLRTASGKTT